MDEGAQGQLNGREKEMSDGEEKDFVIEKEVFGPLGNWILSVYVPCPGLCAGER